MVPASTDEAKGWTITALEIDDVPQDLKCWKGPRNLPKPDARKKRRQEAKQKRKTNRGTYRGA